VGALKEQDAHKNLAVVPLKLGDIDFEHKTFTISEG
jgi:hypothetical protein